MSIAQNQDYNLKLISLGHTKEQEQADRQPESLESSPVVGQCTGLLGEVLATGTTRGNCYKLSPCLKNLNTPHLNL